MMYYIVGFLVLSEALYGSFLNCDRVEFKYENVSIVQAAGICEPDGNGGSSMGTCESTTKMNTEIYLNNPYCHGNPDSSSDISQVFSTKGITDYTITCCTGNPCQFGNVTTYLTNDCNDLSSGLFDSSEISVIGSCLGFYGMSTKYTSCSNDQLKSEFYFNDDCSGDIYYNDTETNGNCDTTEGTRYEITCGYAIDTCSSSECVCDNYTAGDSSWILPDGNGCRYGCYDCWDDICECYDKETCDEWNKIADLVSGLSSIIIVLIIAASVCGLCIIGVIVYCVCAGALCCAAVSRPRKGVASFRKMADNISPDPINLVETTKA